MRAAGKTRAGRQTERHHRGQTGGRGNWLCLDRARERWARILLFLSMLPVVELGRGRRPAQETSNAEIVEGSADQPSQQRSTHWHPPHSGSVSQSVVLKSSDHGEKARAKIA